MATSLFKRVTHLHNTQLVDSLNDRSLSRSLALTLFLLLTRSQSLFSKATTIVKRFGGGVFDQAERLRLKAQSDARKRERERIGESEHQALSAR